MMYFVFCTIFVFVFDLNPMKCILYTVVDIFLLYLSQLFLIIRSSYFFIKKIEKNQNIFKKQKTIITYLKKLVERLLN